MIRLVPNSNSSFKKRYKVEICIIFSTFFLEVNGNTLQTNFRIHYVPGSVSIYKVSCCCNSGILVFLRMQRIRRSVCVGRLVDRYMI